MISSETTKWLRESPKWLQVAAKRLLESDELSEAVIGELAALCQQEANDEFPNVDHNIPEIVFDTHNSEKIHLCSISEIAGVNKLAPKNPLDFGASNIVVIYGHNGSGKSGYVRLLKHICGARDCIRGQLHKNVFSSKEVVQKAKISFRKGNSSAEYEWPGQGTCNDLCSVAIFDTSFGSMFMGNENEVSYEPPALSFFSRLIDICDKVSAKLGATAEALQSRIPSIPGGFLSSVGADWLKNLSAKTPVDEIESHCSFFPEDESKLQDIQKRILERSPADKSKQLNNRKNHVDNIISDVQNYLNQLSDKNCEQIIKAKEQAILKNFAAEIAAKGEFNDIQLEGIGSDVWKELWNAARKYSEAFAYNNLTFPVIQNDSVCVLCHQPLSEKAKQRFRSFESYIKGETQRQAVQAGQEVKQAIDALPNILSQKELKTKMDAAGIEADDIIKELSDLVTTFRERKTNLLTSFSEKTLANIDQLASSCIDKLREISQLYEKSAKKYLEDVANDKRKELQEELKNLQAKKWLAEQKTAVQEEVHRLQESEKIQKAKQKQQTTSMILSRKKGALSKILITDTFIQRFNNELKALGASRLKIKLIKSKVSRCKVLHTIQLDGAHHNHPNDILSEGENRIVSIAAFLADATGKNCPNPILFDDPISSLDQNYEEAFVQRLCSIAPERQVIIFTHRLSLLGMIQDYAKKVSIDTEIVYIREEAWGTGEPSGIPLFVKNPDKALNALINDRLPKAKKLLEENQRQDYEPYAKALCSDFRIILERMIERELLSGVVQRYRRDITTKDKIGNLAKISTPDCEYFDKLMTKYSRYEHSQPIEAPVPLPELDELKSDFNGLKQWYEEFKNRPPKPNLVEN